MIKSAEQRIASRYVPKGSRAVRCKVSGAVAYLYNVGGNGRPCLMGYLGSSGKPAVSYSYRSPEARDKAAAQFLQGALASFKDKAQRELDKRAKLAKGHDLKVGDVLSGIWGYDQTNYEWWQVVALVGKRMVEIRKLCSESIDTGYMVGRCVPLVGQFRDGEPAKRAMVNEYGSVKLYSFCSLSKANKVEVGGVAVGYQAGVWSSYA